MIRFAHFLSKRGQTRMHVYFITFIHMSNADSSDLYMHSIACRMLNEGERDTMSSAYRNMLVQIYSELQKRPIVLNFYDNVIDTNREDAGGHGPSLSDTCFKSNEV